MIERRRTVEQPVVTLFALSACRAQSATEVPPTITPGPLSRAGTMTTIRAVHTASLLQNAELCDPAQNRLTPTGRLAVPRADATATLLANGQVLIVGGYNGSEGLASAELYDPATRSFTATGSMSTARSAHVAVRLEEGCVLEIGGSDARDGFGRYDSAGDLGSQDAQFFSERADAQQALQDSRICSAPVERFGPGGRRRPACGVVR